MSAQPHLSESDLVDLLDARADAGGRAHVESCPSCAERLEALRGTLALLESDEASEPSPLFWEHFPARVQAAVRVEADAGRQWRAWRWAFAAVPVLVVLFALAIVWRPSPASAPAGQAGPGGAARADVAAVGAIDAAPVPADDEATWELVAMLSGSVSEESESEMFAPRLGVAERVAEQLPPEEREALIRLLEEEVGGGPS